MAMKILIIGGTGVISREVLRQLVEKKFHVTIVNRGRSLSSIPDEVEVLYQDRKEKAGFAELFTNRTFDTVIDMISFNADDIRQTIDVFKDKTGQIMIVSSVAAYKRPLRSIPTRESDIEFWESPAYVYGYEKALMEEYIFQRISSAPPITVIRPSLTFGEGCRNVGVIRQNIGILDRIRRSKPLLMFGDGTNPWSFTFTPDLARMMIGLIGNSRAFGEAFHLANQERTNWLDLYLEFGKIAGKEPKILYVPSDLLYKTDPETFGHIYFEKSHPGLFDDTKYRQATGDTERCTKLADGLKDVVRSWEAEGLKPVAILNDMEDSMVHLIKQNYVRMAGLFGES